MIGARVRVWDPGHPYHGRYGDVIEEAHGDCFRVRLDDGNPDFVCGVYTFGRDQIPAAKDWGRPSGAR